MPVFILGSGRSGTSAMFSAIKRATGKPGTPEGHFFQVIDDLYRTLDRTIGPMRGDERYSKRLVHKVDYVGFKNDILRAVASRIEEAYGSQDFLDKTPGPQTIMCAPAALAVWPDTKFIYVQRGGIENISSRLRKFPNATFEHHCKMWVETIEAWHEVRDQLKGSYIEVEQINMATKPNIVAKEVGSFLSLDDEETKKLSQNFRGKRAQSTSEVPRDNLTFEDTGWTEEQKKTFLKICGQTMEKAGYSVPA